MDLDFDLVVVFVLGTSVSQNVSAKVASFLHFENVFMSKLMVRSHLCYVFEVFHVISAKKGRVYSDHTARSNRLQKVMTLEARLQEWVRWRRWHKNYLRKIPLENVKCFQSRYDTYVGAGGIKIMVEKCPLEPNLGRSRVRLRC